MSHVDGEEVRAERSKERLGTAIRTRRTVLGLSRKDLERETELSYPYLTDIEAGKKWPSSRTLWRIAEALGMSPGDLLQLAESYDADGSVAPSRYFHAEPMVAASMAPPPAPAAPAAPRGDEPAADTDPLVELVDAASALSRKDVNVLVALARRLAGRG